MTASQHGNLWRTSSNEAISAGPLDRAPAGFEKPGFEADGWKEGRAPLGYEDERNTELSQEGTSGKASLTAYFRTEFQVDDPELHEHDVTVHND